MEPSRYFYPHNQYSFIIQRFTEIPSSFEILVQPQDTLQFRLPGAAFCFWALLPTHTGCSAPVLHSAASCSQGSKGGHFRQKTGMDGKGGRSHRKRSYSMRPKNTRILVLKVFSKWQWWMKAFNTIQNNGVVCHSYYLGLTARCRLCTKVKQKLSAQDSEDTRRQMQPPQNPATEPMVIQSCGNIFGMVCLPRYHAGYGWLWLRENHCVWFLSFQKNKAEWAGARL